ncbi:unnamed protein product [Heterobilharzia americana]|nr:unnamed protein product [Heterobilharzia americana]
MQKLSSFGLTGNIRLLENSILDVEAKKVFFSEFEIQLFEISTSTSPLKPRPMNNIFFGIEMDTSLIGLVFVFLSPVVTPSQMIQSSKSYLGWREICQKWQTFAFSLLQKS